MPSSRGRRRAATCFAGRVAQLDRHARAGPARPARPSRAAAARLEVAPHDAGDRALRRGAGRPPASRPPGTSVGRDRRSARAAPRRPAAAASSASSPVCGDARERRRSTADASVSDARRLERVVDHARSTALTAPRVGSFWSIIRQITPAANSEIAIGMKTAVLNATDQLIRSVSTAKIEPDRRHERRHDRDPDRVVLDRRAERVAS